MGIRELKARRSEQFQELSSKLNTKNKYQVDPRIWKPTLDSTDRCDAIIRFLPGLESEGNIPYVKMLTYGFKGPTGQWYIENSPVTIGGKDPVYEMNNVNWAMYNSTKDDRYKNLIKRLNKNYYTNIYVVNDPMHPENNGKVMLYRFGVQIMKMIEQAIQPDFDTDKPFDPFDLWTGADFHLKIYKDERSNYQKLERSSFINVGSVLGNMSDEELEVVYSKVHPLKPIIAEDKFKSYDELKNRLNDVLGDNSATKEEFESSVREKEPVVTTTSPTNRLRRPQTVEADEPLTKVEEPKTVSASKQASEPAPWEDTSKKDKDVMSDADFFSSSDWD